MKVLGFLILHTGRPYLRAAVESILPQVDHLVILYCPTPSQGFQTDIPCPDARGELLDEVFGPMMLQAMGSTDDGCRWLQAEKVLWVDGQWSNESDHINAIWPYAEGFDWVWRFDADEVSPPGMVQEMIMQAAHKMHRAALDQVERPSLFRVPFVHFWRCFSRACRDGSHPFRLFKVNGGRGEATLDSKNEKWEVLHFGYAQPTKYITYKMQVSGHRPEWRPDWFESRWLANAQADTHPVMFPTHWMPVDYDKEKLPDVLKKHPYFSMAVIEE